MNSRDIDQAQSRPAFFWGVLVAGALLLGVYIYSGLMIYQHGASVLNLGFAAERRGNAWYVTGVDGTGAAAGKIQAGDRLLALNGDERVERVGPYPPFVTPNSSFTLRIDHAGAEKQVTLFASVESDYRLLARTLSYVFVSVAFYLLALLMGLKKPDERIAQLGCVSLFAAALTLLASGLIPSRSLLPWDGLLVLALTGVVFPIHWALVYHFFYSFPAGVPRTRFWTLLKYGFYAWAFILLVPYRVLDIARLLGQDAYRSLLISHQQLFRTTSYMVPAFQLFAGAAVVAVIVRNFRTVTEQAQRRRIKWIIYASAGALVPIVVLNGAVFILEVTGRLNLLPPNSLVVLSCVVNLVTLFVPIVSCYVIIKHQVFDINVVIRRGLQYLLAKNALRVILALPILGLALTIFANPNRTLAEILLRNSIYFYLMALFAVAAGLAYRSRLSEWVDRKFFREHYNQEKILHELIEDVKKLDSIQEMSRRVSRQVEKALHPERIYLFYREREKRDLRLGYSSGGTTEGLRIPEEFRLLRFMEDQGGALDYPFPRKNNLPQSEKEWLAQLETNLIVPMAGTDDRLAGLLLLGQKKSETPYSKTDRELLEALADQIAIVYENVRLKERIDQDRKIRHEVLARVAERNINLLKECPACGTCFDSASQFCPTDKSELVLSLPVERTIEGRYRLDQLLGKGGMGAVYRSFDLRLHRTVAVKILTGSMFGDSEALRRFEREAQTSARLTHPNIITVYDYGLLSTEGAYLVMEVLGGETLRAVLRREGMIQPAVAAEYFDQVLAGVNAAHRAGIIHRDLKPENIFITRGEKNQGVVKILDFGLARMTAVEGTDSASPTAQFTAPGTVMGTFGYMSPEQLTGGVVDEGTDLFAIGVMVVEALTGRRPFDGKTHHELLINILEGSFHLQDRSFEAEQLDGVLQRCLAKDRKDRYPDAAEMQKEMIPALQNCPPPGFQLDAETFRFNRPQPLV